MVGHYVVVIELFASDITSCFCHCQRREFSLSLSLSTRSNSCPHVLLLSSKDVHDPFELWLLLYL